MSGKILIVDSSSTNRIVLRAVLQGARFSAMGCASPAEALDMQNQTDAQLVIVEWTGLPITGCIAALKDRGVSVIALVPDSREGPRLAALQAGADEILTRPLNEVQLLAQVRALLRGQSAEQDLRPRGAAGMALGFHEDAAPLDNAPGHMVVIGEDDRLASDIHRLTRAETRTAAIHANLEQNAPDVLILDARRFSGQSSLPQMIPDLRSREETRAAMQLVLLPADCEALAATALDLGADEVIAANACPEEIAHRAGRLLKRKRQSDRFKDTVKSGLKAAVTDPLTGLHNRRYALTHLSRAEDSDIAVMMIDIDHFKAINDTHGHATGDIVIQTLADRLRSSVRPGDLVARMGGEEFLIALGNVTEAEAKRVASELRQSVENRPFAILPGKPLIPVTVSVGVAMRFRGETSAEVIDRADQALYKAKTAGRNKVTFHQSAA